ncbi:hypothetical protein RSOLAG22IIIB_13112 [Rhizoctonia solani]|uniref:FAD-binding PCMH-type domain-containing protein n=1 Tax=Rhizoctonia solani TaxID=456999 RepID=A0A0K6GJ18_9AGAM|nr:hypothetical protein RSOLAG22IIIB_13112 [Rhizoctonia solani]
MILDTIAQTPVLVTPLHKEFDRARAHLALAPKDSREATCVHQNENCPPVPPCPVIPPDLVKELRDLVAPGIVLTPEDCDKYEKAVYTGNLLYAGRRPGAVVMTDEAEKLGATVKFAQKYKFELTIKNGGHSYAGYCLNCGGILVFMNTGKFGPGGVKVDLQSSPKTVTIPAGCLWSDVHDYFHRNRIDQMVIGGRCPTVGVSGFTLGGGVSPFSRRYGLGIDNIIKATIVTASGDCIEVSREDTDPKKKDLFWALRGGGGGNFGILTSFTARIHDLSHNDGKVAYGLLTWELPSQQSQFEQMMKVYNSKKWPDRLALDVIWQYKSKKRHSEKQTLAAEVIVIYDGTLEECLEVIAPLIHFAVDISISSMKWWDVALIEQGDPNSTIPFYSHWASLIFGQGSMTETVVSDITKLMEESRKLLERSDPKGMSHLLWVHIGEETAKVDAKDTAFFWRDGVYVCYFKIQWTHCDRDIRDIMFKFVDQVKAKLARHTIQGQAAYVNFVDETISNWQEAYYGDNYPRLQQIKKEWDPNDFFNFEQSIKLPGATDSQTGIEKDQTSAIERPGISWDENSLPDPEKV